MQKSDITDIMVSDIAICLEDESCPSTTQLLAHLQEIRKINFVLSSEGSVPSLPAQSLINQLQSLSGILSSVNYTREAQTLINIHALCLLATDFGGLGHSSDENLDPKEEAEILFLVTAWLESLNSEERSKSPAQPLLSRPGGRRGMTLSEKIFAAHDIDRRGEVKPGDVVRVDVDWIMASELSWSGMERAYDSLGKPGIFRNDRFWLAGDHVVDPRIENMPQVKALTAASNRARKDFRMTEYQGNNYTIMHTEFCRERAQPGMLVIGSDSHTCSAGSVGALAIGLGVADVTMPLITGETWFRIPESVNIRLVNAPCPGIGGKDTILYIMKELKRNTVAADRIVEFTGPGLDHLSCDARFAIANMTTEFGGISGIFVPDSVTFNFINRRKSPNHKKSANYFQPDDDAEYAATHVIDLAQVESFVARYPCPDDVIPVSELAGTALDGCFIGACTTAEEDLILGAMVLEIGLSRGLVPKNHGKRKVVPGSLPILHRLRALGFVAIYEEAGFEVGVPGCSYCVGMGADRAGVGEVWISSQNRNFENRMGQGAIGHLGSAATVAASSFGMEITDPKSFLDEINHSRLQEALGSLPTVSAKKEIRGPTYVEPSQQRSAATTNPASATKNGATTTNGHGHNDSNGVQGSDSSSPHSNNGTSALLDIRSGKVQRLGDFIDTDALAPAEILTSCKTNEEFGAHCLKHTHPEFRARAKDGYNVVVAGSAFGCGSSRENAVSALLGTGIIAVIAKSFAFIYGRNQPNLGLLGITITDETFYEAAVDGVDITINLGARNICIAGQEWDFKLSQMEMDLIDVGGITGAFQKFGKKLFEVMCAPKGGEVKLSSKAVECRTGEELQW